MIVPRTERQGRRPGKALPGVADASRPGLGASELRPANAPAKVKVLGSTVGSASWTSFVDATNPVFFSRVLY